MKGRRVTAEGGTLNELVELLMCEHEDVRMKAHLALAQLSGSREGAQLLQQCTTLMNLVVGAVVTASSQDTTTLLPTTLTTLTNVAATVTGATAVLAHQKILLPALVKVACEPDSRHADRACGLLSNLSRDAECCKRLLSEVSGSLPQLLMVATNTSHNTAGNNLNLLMTVLENISQLPQGSRVLLDREKFMVQRLLPFTQYPPSTARRRAAVATLHNCCFSKDDHLWMLGGDVELATYLCLPLAGPDSFTEEESSELPDQLMYLGQDKTIESESDIRLLLLKALLQLCATRPGREEMRRLRYYLVLRELDKWEKNKACCALLADLVNVLIRTEEEIDAEDLTTLKVPDDLHQKFLKEDEENAEDAVMES